MRGNKQATLFLFTGWDPIHCPGWWAKQRIRFGKVVFLVVMMEYMEDQKYRDEEDLLEKLDSFKNKYAEFDLNDQGEIDMMGLKRMMEKLGVPKTHLEMKKMISEVTEGISDSINYRDFVKMMLGKRSAVLKLVMIFEDKANGAICKPDGPPPKRDIASLP
uniref:allograft inflammatory factor 1-like isoform X1 n=1 Tax=Oncorhynchus gorbuscha TaxID=8017 RepID=UPI001EAEFBDA|nr:allograft inflammatory factor 1-like isoform X1 [Oncorhynchus gorbuscha]